MGWIRIKVRYENRNEPISKYRLQGFKYIGCELDPDYYKQANERLEEYKKQQSLF